MTFKSTVIIKIVAKHTSFIAYDFVSHFLNISSLYYFLTKTYEAYIIKHKQAILDLKHKRYKQHKHKRITLIQML